MSKKILFVDDEQDVLKTLESFFISEGFIVITATDGAQGLSKARAEKPDLVVLDIMLPKIDGYKICRILKFDEKLKKIPVIMLSARVQQEDKELGEEVGADCYITKPVDMGFLAAKVNELLSRPKDKEDKDI